MTYPLAHNNNRLPYEFDRTGTSTFSLNKRGDIFFTTRLQIIRVVDDEEMLRIAQKLVICRYNMITKKPDIFDLDFLFEETTGSLLDFYALSDDVGVLITFNSDSRCVTQYMVQLTTRFATESGKFSGRGMALTICERRKTINGLLHSISLGFGLMSYGKLFICGVRAPGLTPNRASDVTEIEGHIIAANPLHADKLPDVDLTEQLFKLSCLVEKMGSDEKLWTMAPFIDRNGLYMYITKTDRVQAQSSNLVTGKMAMLQFGKNGRFSVSIHHIDDAAIRLPMYPHINVHDLLPPSHRGRTAFIPMLIPDYADMMTYRFRIYHTLFYCLLYGS